MVILHIGCAITNLTAAGRPEEHMNSSADTTSAGDGTTPWMAF